MSNCLALKGLEDEKYHPVKEGKKTLTVFMMEFDNPTEGMIEHGANGSQRPSIKTCLSTKDEQTVLDKNQPDSCLKVDTKSNASISSEV